MRGLIFGAALLGAALSVSVSAKAPAAGDEAQIRSVIHRVYESYTMPPPDAPTDGSYAPENDAGSAMDGYEPPYTATLNILVDRWGSLMKSSDELYRLNSFDWFCQCQDNDNRTAKILKQNYAAVGKDRIDVNVLFSPGRSESGDSGEPLLFRFKREAGVWKLDDLKFYKFITLRKALARDIQDVSKDRGRN